MKKIITVCTLMIVFGATSFGQNRWNFAGYFPDSLSTKKATGVHGLAVDPAGKLWIQYFGRTDSLPDPGAGGAFFGTLAIYVYNANGTPASFSPLKVLAGAGVNDTLWTAPAARALSNRGIRKDHNGNILISIFNAVYRVNYLTGAVMNKVVVDPANSITSVGVDTLGEFFVQTVVGGNPIRIFAPNFSSLGNVTDTSRGFCRTGEVSKDGNDYYSTNYTLHSIYRYHSDFGSFGPYVVGPNDTLFKGFDCESIGWNWARTRLWASSGSKNDYPNRYPGVTTNWTVNTWYAWNPANGQITDSIKWAWNGYLDSINIRPRGIAFGPDGNTAYVGCFGSGSVPSVQKFTFGPSSVEEDFGVVPVAFELSQNYPNPFNPSTEIKFTLTKSGFTTLKVYDMLGREVATLVNENLGVGAFKATFDASNLTSGTYLYRLTANGQSISKKMMLVK